MIEKILPQKEKIKIQTLKLEYVRLWTTAVMIVYILNQMVNLRRKEDLIPVWIQAIHWLLTLMILVSIIYSRIKNIRAVFFAIFFLQMRSYQGFFQQTDILDSKDDPRNTVFFSMLIFLSIIMNQTMISHIVPSPNIINVINIAISIAGLIHRIYGWSNI